MDKNQNRDDPKEMRMEFRQNRRQESQNLPDVSFDYASTGSASVPVIYQSMKVEIQTLLDKMTSSQVRDVIESAEKIRDTAMKLKNAQETKRKIGVSDEEFSYFGSEGKANDVVSQITMLRETEMNLLKSENFAKSVKIEEDGGRKCTVVTLEQTQPLTAEIQRSLKKIPASPKSPNAAMRNVLEDAAREDHVVPIEELEIKYNTNRTCGLSNSEVLIHRQRDGPNVLKQQKSLPQWLVYLKTLVAGFGLILWVAVVLCFIAYGLGDPPDPYNLVLGFILLIVIFVQGTFSYVQERKATNLIASFTKMMPSNCQVLRDNGWTSVQAVDLVVGDIIRVREGDKLPADVRVFETAGGKVEKSSLTGESDAVPLSATPTDRNIYETHNMALFGTSMTEGTATGMIVNTGDRTVMGKLAQMASTTKSVSTSLQKEITRFMLIIVTLAVTVCVIVFGGYFLLRKSHPNFLSIPIMITNCIAIAVALLPDGLPIAITTIMTLVGKRLHSEMILVKKLTVTETLGSATLIASDKTGTLTANQMTLNHVWIIDEHSMVERKNSLIFDECKAEDKLERSLPGCFNLANMGKSVTHPAVAYLMQVMCLCNKSNFEMISSNKNKSQLNRNTPRKIIGNPTEGALLTAAEGFIDTDHFRGKVPIHDEIPFSSRKKIHLTLHQVNDQTVFTHSERMLRMINKCDRYNYMILLKGAPEYILSVCTTAIANGEEMILDKTLIEKIMQSNEHLAAFGERVLGFAFKLLPSGQYPTGMEFNMKDESHWMKDLCFLGLTGIIDPPRPGVGDAINECHEAGIRVMMVTGDQPATAVAISRMVNIITQPSVKTIQDVTPLQTESNVTLKSKQEQIQKKFTKFFSYLLPTTSRRKFLDEAIVITGTDIPGLTTAQWDFVLSHREVVFARTTPQHKLQIVKESQARGDITAVTGDGVNDAPALKAANLGVAMGICGSDVSKEAANMVLLDDNFVTIVRGIKEGRLLFDNLKKVICYLLPAGSFSEILPVLAAVFLGMPQPLSAFLMIVICVGTDMCGSLGLVHEKAESDIMHRQPRNSKTDHLVNGKIILFTYCFIGTMESIIAFFMYFLTMWMGNVPPSKLMFAYENWGTDFNITTGGQTRVVTADIQSELNYTAQTAFFVSLVVTQLWNLLSVRTRIQSSIKQKFDPRLLWYMLGEIVIMLFMCYLPLINEFTGTRPMKWYHFVIPAALGSILFVLDEIRKLLCRKFPTSIFGKLAW